MNQTLKNLEDIRIFIKVIESGSFTAAANRLNLSPTTVSKQITRLEKNLNIHLFERSTRSMRLTQEGKILASKFRQALILLDEAEQFAQDSHEKLTGIIKITAPLPLGRQQLAIMTAKFQQLYPDIGFMVHLSDHLVNLYECDIDLAIRVAHLTDSNLVARKLANNQRILVAAPEYLQKYGIPKHPADLYQHQCLLFSTQGMSQIIWKLNNTHEQMQLTLSSQMVADSGDILTCWSELGLGIALRESWEVAELIRAGKLIHVLPDWHDDNTPIYIVRTIRAPIPARIKYFIDFLIQEWRICFPEV
ncbi:LysR family transcriptional regulator [Acinetobacter qingfengensis]|uniref:LysR family transcriptional regulator n=1 Tax=Acinetobacter qingfengensis TaxID=1262585 RepID=A0A1E7RCN2_9GAMM|nr:LysR family transcriptional regulator [Acinetobacter qingfengensis]KAA8734328.1 LysR family transcriptional regulator [Acinetobacter qingfengensis]OEY97091.1 LysR family transcriptional regulator [Acinetobacter qingfengensis]